MGQAADRQQGDDCAVMRQRVQTAGSQRSNPVQHLGIQADLVGPGQPVFGHGGKCDRHTAGSRTGDTGQHVDCDSFREQWRSTEFQAEQEIRHLFETGQSGDDVAVTDLGCGVHDREQRADRTGVDRFGHGQVLRHRFVADGDCSQHAE